MTTTIHLSQETLKSFIFCDAKLLAIEWIEGSMEVRMRLLDLSRGLTLLIFEWVAELRVDLKWSANCGGATMTWESGFSEHDGRWRGLFDFGSDGFIEFTCSEGRLERLDKNPSAH